MADRSGPVAAGLTSFEPDRSVALWFRDHVMSSEPVVAAGEVVALALHPWTFRVMVAVGCVLAWRAGRRRAAVVAAAVMAAGGLLGLAVKLAVARPRPAWGEPVAAESGYAFPSLHALNAALGAGLLLVVLAAPWLRRRSRATVAAVTGAAVLLVGVTALDRLVLGVHYLSDVAAGVLLGVVLTALAARLSGGRPSGGRPSGGEAPQISSGPRGAGPATPGRR